MKTVNYIEKRGDLSGHGGHSKRDKWTERTSFFYICC